MSQDASDHSVGDLPEEVADWIGTLAEQAGLSEEEMLGRLQAVMGENDPMTVPADSDLESTVTELDVRIENLEAELDTKIADVRERVVQVKRETDEKASEEHGHPKLEVELEHLEEELDTVREELQEVESDLRDVDESVTSETETLREDLAEHVSDISGKLNVLAVTVIDVRDNVQSLLADRQQTRHLETLRTDANRHGVRAASCGSCGGRVEIGLLNDARCPHCNERFEDLDPKQGFFGSNVLETGSPPALEGEVELEDADLTDIIEE